MAKSFAALPRSSLWIACVLSLSVAAAAFVAVAAKNHRKNALSKSKNNTSATSSEIDVTSSSGGGDNSSGAAAPGDGPNMNVSVAFCGNSILYFNDCPRLVQQMIEAAGAAAAAGGGGGTARVTVTQDSCLRGGATLTTLWKHGNGMSQKFATPQAIIGGGTSETQCTSNSTDDGECKNSTTPIVHDVGAASVQDLLSLLKASPSKQRSWDYVVLNDYTQGPARAESRAETVRVLLEQYAPLLMQHGAIPILVQTPAYRKQGIKDTADLGDFDAFSDRLALGVQSYVEALRGLQSSTKSDDNGNNSMAESRVAPVGEAYRYLHRHNHALWKKLYSWDDFHPSPYGTWLQACVIYCTMFSPTSSSSSSTTTITASGSVLKKVVVVPPQQPPVYNALWWERSRYMQPPDEKPLPLPTQAEAAELRRVACLVCGLVLVDDENNDSDGNDEGVAGDAAALPLDDSGS